MTVGRALCEHAGFRLFHNHHTIEPLLEIFGFGTPPFSTLNGEFRLRVIEEAAAAGIRLVFTFVWNVEEPAEGDEVRRLVAPYVDAGLRVSVVGCTPTWRPGWSATPARPASTPSAPSVTWPGPTRTCASWTRPT